MANIISKYVGKGRVETDQNKAQTTLYTDAPQEVGGQGEYLTPGALLVRSLLACSLTTMAISAERSGIDLTGAYAEVTGIHDNDAEHRMESIDVTFHLSKDLDEKSRKKMEHLATKACYVGNSLNVKENYTFVYE